MHKLTVEYTPQGRAIRDDRLEHEYQIILIRLQHNDVACRFSTRMMILRIRVGVVEGDIPHENVLFTWQDQEFTLDKDGCFNRSGFPDVLMELLWRLITAPKEE